MMIGRWFKKRRSRPVAQEPPTLTIEWSQSSKRDSKLKGFLDLPRELRDKVYYEVLCVDVPMFIGTINFAESSCGWGGVKFCGLPKRPALLRTCRKLHNEAAAMLYGRNSFEMMCSLRTRYTGRSLTVGKDGLRSKELPFLQSSMTWLPFHPMYQALVCNRSFQSETTDAGEGVQFMVLMMICLRDVEGAFFRVLIPGRTGLLPPWAFFFAGWRQKDNGRTLLTHAKDGCRDLSTVEFTAAGDTVMMTMLELIGMDWRGLSNLKQLRTQHYKVRIHVCESIEQYATIYELLRSKPRCDMSCAFTPVLSNGVGENTAGKKNELIR